MTGDFKPVFCRRVKKYLHFIFFVRQKFVYLHSERVRGVAQPGLEYASGGVWSQVRILSPRLMKRLGNLMIAEPFSFMCSSGSRVVIRWVTRKINREVCQNSIKRRFRLFIGASSRSGRYLSYSLFSKTVIAKVWGLFGDCGYLFRVSMSWQNFGVFSLFGVHSE